MPSKIYRAAIYVSNEVDGDASTIDFGQLGAEVSAFNDQMMKENHPIGSITLTIESVGGPPAL